MFQLCYSERDAALLRGLGEILIIKGRDFADIRERFPSTPEGYEAAEHRCELMNRLGELFELSGAELRLELAQAQAEQPRSIVAICRKKNRCRAITAALVQLGAF